MRVWDEQTAATSLGVALRTLAGNADAIGGLNLARALDERDVALVGKAQATREFARIGELEKALENLLPPRNDHGEFTRTPNRPELEAYNLLYPGAPQVVVDSTKEQEPEPKDVPEPGNIFQLGSLAIHGSAVPDDGLWHHIVVTRRYLDGRLVEGDPRTYAEGISDGYHEGHADGHLAGVAGANRRYGKALRKAGLSKKVRKAILKAGRPKLSYTEQVKADGPLAYWRLDEKPPVTIDFLAKRPEEPKP